ncbi:MAG: thiol:disulfide interchange protein DsbG [Pseudomonadota bacterium]|nr:thiol:disulfide interchange protein DsbG [Pseudomonadota bacterium]
MRHHFVKFLFLALFLLQATPALAQGTPPLPPPIQNLKDEGAQLRYLGQQHGLDGWIAIKGGQEQYFYVTKDGQAFVMGVLFDRDGKMVTLRQVKELQDQSGAETLSFFAEEEAERQALSGGATAAEPVNQEFKTPSEQLYDDVESANWIKLGRDGAPVLYSFMDPQCPYCHAFMNDLRANYIENGLVQVRMIPVGFRADTKAQAAFLLAVPNPQRRWYEHLAGDETALPISADINEQGVERNLAIMQSWKVNVTPFSVYRAKNGEVKIIQGRAQDLAQLISDLNGS